MALEPAGNKPLPSLQIRARSPRGPGAPRGKGQPAQGLSQARQLRHAGELDAVRLHGRAHGRLQQHLPRHSGPVPDVPQEPARIHTDTGDGCHCCGPAWCYLRRHDGWLAEYFHRTPTGYDGRLRARRRSGTSLRLAPQQRSDRCGVLRAILCRRSLGSDSGRNDSVQG